jgi:hypothetical protein
MVDLLAIGNDVFMRYMRMDLRDKRFRSKASSASGLSPNNLAFSNMEGFIFLRRHYCGTVSKERGEGLARLSLL